MHTSIKFLPLLFAALTAALPSIDKRAGVPYDDNVSRHHHHPVGTYHGLVYKGAVVVPPKVPGFSDIVPHSKPNGAGSAHPLDTLQLGTINLGAFIQITRAPGVKSFDLNSFWYGLATDDATSVGIAQGGTIAVVAFDVKGNQNSTTSYSYAPTGLVNQPLAYAQLPDTYKNLQNVTIGIAVAEPLTERTYFQVDNLKHVNYS